MKIYYLCDACEMVVKEEETEGEGVVFLRTMCEDCAREMGLLDEGHFSSRMYYS